MKKLSFALFTLLAALSVFLFIRQNQEPPVPLTKKADLVVFSYDRPLQLYAFLESLEKYVKNVGETTVIIRSSGGDYDKGYKEIKRRWPKVHYLTQGSKPKRDFKPYVLKSTFKTPNSYVLYGVDDIVIRDEIDLEECINWIEKTGALGFYLRLGEHTDFCYMENKYQGIPESIYLGNDVFVWQFKDGEGDFGYPHTVDMTLYRKEDIRGDLEEIDFTTPNTFETEWAEKARLHQMGLYYRKSKIVNLPLNLVNDKQLRKIGSYTVEQLLEKFTQGFKLDIGPLHELQNRSAHVDMEVSFIPRDSQK